jgi:two-component system, OmpR family, sensor kinase
VTRIIRLIDNLVDTSRVMDGDANLFFHPEPIALVDVLHDVCRLQREISPGALILEDFGKQPLPLCGDPKLLAQTFGNLLGNAIKYSPADPRVRVRAKLHGSVISVAVEDDGIGIPGQDITRLFTRYFRGSNVSGFVGSGVGLFLVATVLHLHGGDIAVESSEGQGSRFTATLPAGQSHDATPCPPAARSASLSGG